MTKTEKAVEWAEQIAADNSHGYKWGGWGPDYDCGHLVIEAFQQAGILLKSAGATYTGNMRTACLKCGFTDVTAGVNLQTGSGLRRGDILLNYSKHAALCTGMGKLVQARSDMDGRAGDSSGREIQVQAYYNYPWNCVLRPPVSDAPAAQPAQPAKTAESYTVKAGDTLSYIAALNGISWADLAAWNGIKSPYIIHPGQVLTLQKPAGGGESSKPESGAAQSIEAELKKADKPKETERYWPPRVVDKNMVGSDVLVLQSILSARGYCRGDINGRFQDQTEAAVKNFQRDSGLVVDGVVGKLTWSKLLNIN